MCTRATLTLGFIFKIPFINKRRMFPDAQLNVACAEHLFVVLYHFNTYDNFYLAGMSCYRCQSPTQTKFMREKSFSLSA